MNQLLLKDVHVREGEKLSERVLDQLRAPLYHGSFKFLELLELKAAAHYLRRREKIFYHRTLCYLSGEIIIAVRASVWTWRRGRAGGGGRDSIGGIV